MNKLPEKIKDLVSSPERLEIFEVVSSLEDTFTIKDVYYRLHQQGFKIRITTVQTLLKGLSNRGYLKHFDLKLGTSRGRSTIHFQRAKSMS